MNKYYVESTVRFVQENETKVLPESIIRTVDWDRLKIHGVKRVVIETNEEVFDWCVA